MSKYKLEVKYSDNLTIFKSYTPLLMRFSILLGERGIIVSGASSADDNESVITVDKLVEFNEVEDIVKEGLNSDVIDIVLVN